MNAVRKCLVFFCCLSLAQAHAQNAVVLSHYVFDQFMPGKVQQKNGTSSDAKLNYNILSGEMIFESAPGKYLALANPEQADTVFIAGRKFVPVGNRFYELLLKAPIPLLVEYTCTVKEPGNDIGYGMSSVTSASPAVKSLIQSGGAYSLKLPDGFEVISNAQYWVIAGGKNQKANSARQLAAALPDKKEKINELVKKNNSNFNKQQDIVDLLLQL